MKTAGVPPEASCLSGRARHLQQTAKSVSCPSLHSQVARLEVYLSRQALGTTSNQTLPGRVSGTVYSAKLPSWGKRQAEPLCVALCLLAEQGSLMLSSSSHAEKNPSYLILSPGIILGPLDTFTVCKVSNSKRAFLPVLITYEQF